jgi:hypothetical protein
LADDKEEGRRKKEEPISKDIVFIVLSISKLGDWQRAKIYFLMNGFCPLPFLAQ